MTVATWAIVVALVLLAAVLFMALEDVAMQLKYIGGQLRDISRELRASNDAELQRRIRNIGR